MSYTFRPAQRKNVGLLIGLAGGTGSGKTYSGMKLAKGLAQGKPFAVIDTEAGRALHYAPADPANPQPNEFVFEHLDLQPPFSPDNYLGAIEAAEAAGYPVILVDSMSHEHAGDGGLLDMQEAELNRMAGDDWKKREACAMAAWVKPKGEHKRMVSKLLQLRSHLILCFRAEQKLEMRKNDRGKTEIALKEGLTLWHGWTPICEKKLPYEMTTFLMLTMEAPGVPKPIKLSEQHRPFFPLDRPITEESGKMLGLWAGGGMRPPSVEEMNAANSLEELNELAARAKTAPAGSRDKLRKAYKQRKQQLEESYGEGSQEPAPGYGEEPQD